MNLTEIQALINANRVEEAIEQLNAIIADRPDDDALYFVRGNAFWKLGDRKHALDDYSTARISEADTSLTTTKAQNVKRLISLKTVSLREGFIPHRPPRPLCPQRQREQPQGLYVV